LDGDWRDAVDRAWDSMAADLQEANPPWKVSHDAYGFTAAHGVEKLRSGTFRGIRALLDSDALRRAR
jgi:hypothetical protein